ncbi:acyltransferase domain-containing protein [Archangium gephyra]|nr:acyltransferase domain-containing protein [Archangium gephyra]
MRWTSKESRMRHEGQTGSGEGPCRPVFVFSGQGSQWTGMGRALLERSTVFALVLKACDVQVRRLMGWSLLEALTAEDARLGDIEVSCPAIVSMEIALAALWRSWGIEPAAVVGHSIGEVAAAHVAGVLSLEDAMRVICHQGRTVGKLKGKGAMAVVGLPWARVGEALPEFAGQVWRVIHASPSGRWWPRSRRCWTGCWRRCAGAGCRRAGWTRKWRRTVRRWIRTARNSTGCCATSARARSGCPSSPR